MEQGIGIGKASIRDRIFEKFQAIAYGIVIVTYILCFCEYIYLRLTSLLLPDHFKIHQKICHRSDELIGKTAWNYSIAILIFAALATFKLLCFFLLTVSDEYLQKENLSLSNLDLHHIVPITAEEAHLQQLKIYVKKVANETMVPAFGIYTLCSVVIFLLSYYVLGINDSLDFGTSKVLIFVFDGIMVIYLISFPVITIIYHPDFHCWGNDNNTRKFITERLSVGHRNGEHAGMRRLEKSNSDDSISKLSEFSPKIDQPISFGNRLTIYPLSISTEV
uniref:G_PROTEIN_RECEP_F1_2 domain-containing protein n=1 Tax=Rhabditophanes sp. KR3021 TaxID=114890 RepID=A0AC35TTG2_9BILA